MSQPDEANRTEYAELSIKAGQVFHPRRPISTREFFAGRWEQLTTIADAVSQSGLHIIIFGERGVGKTSLANVIGTLVEVFEEDLPGSAHGEPRLVVKVNAINGDHFGDIWKRAFDEVSWVNQRPTIGFTGTTTAKRITLRSALDIPDNPSMDDVRRALNVLKRSVFIFDEFDRGSSSIRKAFTDLIKTVSDYSVDSTIVIVGVSDTVDELLKDHASVVRSITQIQLPRMTEKELQDIIEKAAKVLEVEFSPESVSLIVRVSQGLPHYTHLIGLHATREAVNRLSKRVEAEDVHKSFEKAVKQAIQSIQVKHLQAIRSAHKDALYEEVLLACAIVSSTLKDALGYFHPSDVVNPLSTILRRTNVQIATFQKHINEFCEPERGPILYRHGKPRAYKYRFLDPLLPPYVFMTCVSNGKIDSKLLAELTASS
ncbi:MAG: hypothetical protein V2A79_17990 [Planctomycetota bacterium]